MDNRISVTWQKPASLNTFFGRDIRIEPSSESVEVEKQFRSNKPVQNPDKPTKHSDQLRSKGTDVQSDANRSRMLPVGTRVDRSCLNVELGRRHASYLDTQLNVLGGRLDFLFPDPTRDPRIGAQTKTDSKHMYIKRSF